MVFTEARWSYLLSLSPSIPRCSSLPLRCSPPPLSFRSLALLSLPPLLCLAHIHFPSDPLCAAVDLNLKWWETKLAALTAETNSLSLSPGPIWVSVRYWSRCQHLTCDNDDKLNVCWLSLFMHVCVRPCGRGVCAPAIRMRRCDAVVDRTVTIWANTYDSRHSKHIKYDADCGEQQRKGIYNLEIYEATYLNLE